MDETTTNEGNNSSAATTSLMNGAISAPTETPTDTTTETKQPELIAGKFKDVDTLVNSYKELEKKLGEKSSAIKLPTAESSPEEIDAFYKQLGRPENIDGYQLELPEGATVNDELLNSMKAAALKGNLSDAQFKEMAKAYMALEQQFAVAWNKNVEETQATLKSEYGDKFDANMKGAWNTLKTLVGDTKAVELNNRYGHDADFVRLLVQTANQVSEDSVGNQSQANFSGIESATRDRNAIINDKNNQLHQAYWNRKDPNHSFAVDEVRRLNAIIDK